MLTLKTENISFKMGMHMHGQYTEHINELNTLSKAPYRKC